MVVDASVWIARSAPDESRHTAAALWLREHREGELTVPTLALAEVAGALARRFSRRAAAAALQQIRAIPWLEIVVLDESLALEAADVAATYRLRGADAVYVAIAARLRVSLVTLDREVASRVAAVINVVQP